MKVNDAKITISLHSTDCGEAELEELQVWLAELLSFVRQRNLSYQRLAQRIAVTQSAEHEQAEE